MSQVTNHRITDWATPATDYMRGRVGSVEIRTEEIGPTKYLRRSTTCEITHPVKITKLLIDGEINMRDDPLNWWNMKDHAQHFFGDVLVGGLGLGLIVHCLCQVEDVKTITVIEQNQDVIDFVWKYMPKETGKALAVINDDFWNAAKDIEGADGVFYDLFVDDGRNLVGSAMNRRVQLDRLFGEVPIRIHGFENSALDEFSQSVKQANHAVKEDVERIMREL